MTRITSEFDEWRAACAAVDALVAGSFPVEDVRVHALRADGTSAKVPIRTRSHLLHGVGLGALIGCLVGIVVAWIAGVDQPLTFGALSGGSIGSVAGGAIGLGSWAVQPDRRRVPGDARSYVVAVVVPEGRAEAAGSILTKAGGREAGLRSLPADR